MAGIRPSDDGHSHGQQTPTRKPVAAHPTRSGLVATASEAARARRGDRVGFVREIAGGVASYADVDSPHNKVIGLGFAGVPTADELTELERAFHELGAPMQVELSNLADPAIGGLLTTRGYQLTAYENVLGTALDGRAAPEPPPGIEIRRCRDDEDELALDLIAEAVLQPDAQGAAVVEDFPRDALLNGIRDMTAAGTKSQQNVQRHGFDLLYTRAILLRER